MNNYTLSFLSLPNVYCKGNRALRVTGDSKSPLSLQIRLDSGRKSGSVCQERQRYGGIVTVFTSLLPVRWCKVNMPGTRKNRNYETKAKGQSYYRTILYRNYTVIILYCTRMMEYSPQPRINHRMFLTDLMKLLGDVQSQ